MFQRAHRRGLTRRFMAIALVLGCAISLGAWRNTFPEIELLMNIRGLVIDNYVEIVDEQHMDEGAIRGLVTSTDPYNSLLSPGEPFPYVSSEKENAEVGYDLGVRDGVLTVISVQPDSPADDMGLTSGDKILEIQDTNAFEHLFSVYEASRSKHGPEGATLTLNVYREGKADAEDLKDRDDHFSEIELIYRKLTPRKAIEVSEPDLGVQVIQVNSMDAPALGTLKSLLATASGKSSLRKLILDLRNNSQASIEQGVALADLFVADGKELGTIKGHATKAIKAFTSGDGASFTGLPVTVLVDGGTAEGAEVCAAILKELAAFPVAGEKTFGKTTYFKTVEFTSSGRKLVILHGTFWLPGAKETVHDAGVEPTTTILSTRPTLIASAEKNEDGETIAGKSARSSKDAAAGASLIKLLNKAARKDLQLEKVITDAR